MGSMMRVELWLLALIAVPGLPTLAHAGQDDAAQVANGSGMRRLPKVHDDPSGRDIAPMPVRGTRRPQVALREHGRLPVPADLTGEFSFFHDPSKTSRLPERERGATRASTRAKSPSSFVRLASHDIEIHTPVVRHASPRKQTSPTRQRRGVQGGFPPGHVTRTSRRNAKPRWPVPGLYARHARKNLTVIRFGGRFLDVDGDKIVDLYCSALGGQTTWRDINDFAGVPLGVQSRTYNSPQPTTATPQRVRATIEPR